MQIFDFFKKKPLQFLKFSDSFGNFEINYPKGWKYDKTIAVVDGQYTNSFHSGDSNFTIATNTKIPANFDFKKYAKSELESPSSGILTKAIKSKYLDMPAYLHNYFYVTGGKKYFGGGIMFFTGKKIFSLTWNAPDNKKQEFEDLFNQMLKSLRVVR